MRRVLVRDTRSMMPADIRSNPTHPVSLFECDSWDWIWKNWTPFEFYILKHVIEKESNLLFFFFRVLLSEIVEGVGVTSVFPGPVAKYLNTRTILVDSSLTFSTSGPAWVGTVPRVSHVRDYFEGPLRSRTSSVLVTLSSEERRPHMRFRDVTSTNCLPLEP